MLGYYNILLLLLQAARRNLTYPRYVWITFGWYPDSWWTQAVSTVYVPCTDEELEAFILNARMIQIRQYPTPNDIDETTIAGIVR